MNKFWLFFAIIGLSLSLSFCGGGGGGGGSAGQQSVLSIVNATKDAASLDTTVDGEIFSSDLRIDDVSAFQSVLAGDRMIEVIETLGNQRKIELQNNFSFGIPYTLVISGSGDKLSPILALNDRSDTPPAKFRIRAIGASTKAALSVRLISGIIGRTEDTYLSPGGTVAKAILKDTEVDNTSIALTVAVPTSVPTITVPTVTVPTTISETPPSPTATPIATGTNVAPISNVTLAQNLEFSAVSDYTLVPKGDYRIVVESKGNTVAQSGVISFVGGQVISVVVKDASVSVGGTVAILRLNDKP